MDVVLNVVGNRFTDTKQESLGNGERLRVFAFSLNDVDVSGIIVAIAWLALKHISTLV